MLALANFACWLAFSRSGGRTLALLLRARLMGCTTVLCCDLLAAVDARRQHGRTINTSGVFAANKKTTPCLL